MTPTRPHPFDMVFGAVAESRFPAIRDSVGAEPELDAFVMAQAVVELLHELRPDEGIGEAIDDFVAFVHAAFRYWAAGAATVNFDDVSTRALCMGAPVAVSESTPETALYIQVAPRLIWGQLDPEASYEPLDGWFMITADGRTDVVACFGVHPGRPGLSVLVLGGPRPDPPPRADGRPWFAATMPGGGAANLHAIEGPDEMLLLAWRVRDLTEGG